MTSPGGATAPRSILGIPEFRPLLGARLASGLAMSALATVVGYQVYLLSHSPLALGGLGLVEAIPAISLSLFGGHLADRRDRRSIVLVTASILVVCALALTLVAALAGDTAGPGAGMGALAAILGVIFVTGIASGFSRPALSAFEAQVIPLEFAATGASWSSSVSQAGSIAGPALGGIAYAVVGPAATYLLIAVLLAIEVTCTALIARKPMPQQEPGVDMLESLTSGVRYVLRRQELVGAMALDLFAVLFGGAIALLPIFASDILHVGSIGLGLLRTAPSVGALLVMLVATRRPPLARAGGTLLICVAGFGLSILVFAASTNFFLSLAALVVSGITDGVSMIIRSVILRVMSPEHLRGRIAAVNWVFIGASNEIGAFESGIAATFLGTVPSVLAGGVVTLLIVAVVAVAAPDLRRLDLRRHGAGRREATPPAEGTAS
jgi:MFS family permease